MTEEWLTAEEAATGLRTRPQTIYEMVREGKFGRLQWIGKSVRIHRSEIYPQVAEITPVNPDLTRYIAEIRHRLDELEALVRAS